MPLPPFAQFTHRLETRLAQELPGAEAQVKMAPRYKSRMQATSVDGRDCREAGVLALLYPDVTDTSVDPQPHVVLTVRREDLPDHAGQVSFPGGQREDGETLRETALREAHEEVDLDPSPVEIIGALTPLFIPPSKFCVHPFVGFLRDVPTLRPTDREVGEILHVPLPQLLAPETHVVETWTLHGLSVDVPFYDVGGQKVWGATAMMLSELLAVVRDVELQNL